MLLIRVKVRRGKKAWVLFFVLWEIKRSIEHLHNVRDGNGYAIVYGCINGWVNVNRAIIMGLASVHLIYT